MALILSTTTCAICDEKLDRPFLTTSGVAFVPGHPLFEFCDAPLHFDCVEAWPSRIEFSEAYFRLVLEYHEAGHGYLLKKKDDWFFSTGPYIQRAPDTGDQKLYPYYVEV